MIRTRPSHACHSLFAVTVVAASIFALLITSVAGVAAQERRDAGDAQATPTATAPSFQTRSDGDNGAGSLQVVGRRSDDRAHGAADDLAVPSGEITIFARECAPNTSLGSLGIGQLLQQCTGTPIHTFTLDLGWWSGAQTVGEVIPDGVYWEPALGPDPLTIQGPNASIASVAYCGAGFVQVPVVDGAITTTLTPDADTLSCYWFTSVWIS